MKLFPKVLGLAVATVIFTGCATKTITTVYCHDESYTKSMYLYLQGEPNYDEQVELMNKYFAKAEETGTQPAPGSYAHMAMVCSKVGNDADAFKYLNLEKEKFPESASYIDFLVNKKKNTKE